MFNNSVVVVPWDFSEHSKLALNYAMKNVALERIRVICVLEMPNPYSAGLLWGEDAQEKARKLCREQFFSVVDQTKINGTQFKAEFGDPATEIVRATDNWNADLIVISSHGRSGISRLMLGSTAQKVSKLAHCPVLLLPNIWFERESSRDSEASEVVGIQPT